MSDEITDTEAAVVQPELWSQQMVDYMYAAPIVMNRVHRVDREIVSMGTKINLPKMPAISVNNVGSDGSLTNQALTYTETELSISYHREASVKLLKSTSVQANRDILADFRRQFPDALMADIEGYLLGLHSSISTYTEGDTTSVPNEDLLTAAISDLLGANLGMAMRNPNNVSFCFHTSLWKYLKKVQGWVDASATGESVGGRLKLEVPNLYGIPVYMSSLVASSTGRRNLLFMREALALGIQKGIDITDIPVEALAKKITADCMFGVAAYNEARAVKITTATS